MEKSGKEIVLGAGTAGPDFHAEEPRVCRDDEHVSEHGGFRNARRLGPPFLEAEASAHAGEFTEHGVVLVKEIGHADDVAHVVEPVNEAGFNLRKLVVHLVDGFEKLEFRVGGIEVRGVQDAASEALVLGLHEILVEPVVNRHPGAECGDATR